MNLWNNDSCWEAVKIVAGDWSSKIEEEIRRPVFHVFHQSTVCYNRNDDVIEKNFVKIESVAWK